jgi:2-polyprenyl-6-methoxyphenol hydroxylase-like FAD-dependent oxidoreductase
MRVEAMNNDGITELTTKCCVVGGGPAGMMLGFLLARAGVDVVVMEKHGDFLRDFRGDTVHPSTLELMHELGLLDELLKRPHQEVAQLGAEIGNDFMPIADFSYLPTRCKFIALMPQWDFLNFLSEHAKTYSTFALRMKSEATGLLEENGRVVGVKATTESGELHVRADLIVGADGRGSIIRQSAGFEVEDLGAPMDVLWFRLSRKSSDPPQTVGRINIGVIFIMLNRGDYWQCGFVISKGKLEQLQKQGLDKFRDRIVEVAPFTADRVDELKDWDQIKLLTVKVDRLQKWYREGLLCIGDSAHAMSPIGGVGINLAVQDAVATANILYEPLLRRACSEVDLQKVQKRRTFPTKMTQGMQVFLQRKFVAHTLESQELIKLPWFVRLIAAIPILHAIPAAIVGIGFRAEHIHSPDVQGSRKSN